MMRVATAWWVEWEGMDRNTFIEEEILPGRTGLW